LLTISGFPDASVAVLPESGDDADASAEGAFTDTEEGAGAPDAATADVITDEEGKPVEDASAAAEAAEEKEADGILAEADAEDKASATARALQE
jgi:hypothetical protein